MISRIVLVCAVAFVMYILLPLSGSVLVSRKWKRLLSRLRKEPGEIGLGTGFTDIGLRVHLVGANRDAEILITPGNTAFYMLRKDEAPEKLTWRTLFLLQHGTTLYYIQSKKKFTSDICLFFEEKTAAALKEKLNTLSVPYDVSNPVKPYFTAIGAFIEFILFLEYIKDPALGMASIAALVAIFGKALPYCPPGLFFTLAAHAQTRKISPTARVSGTGIKKNRQRRAAGVLLMSAGIVLNIGVIFFVIRTISL